MKKLWRLACLIVSVLLGGSLVAPLSVEAGNPTLFIDGNPIGLTQGGPGCGNDTGFINGSNSVLNSCYSINGTNATTDATRSATIRIGNWYVGDYATGNQARVLINDTSTGTDNMKLTGVTFTSATQTSSSTTAQVGHVVLVQVFNNAPNGTGAIPPNYIWGMSEGGYFDPPNPNSRFVGDPGETVLNDRFRLIGTGCFTNSCTASGPFTVSLGTTLDTGVFVSPGSAGVNGGVSRSNTASTVQPSCNTGSNRCAPTLKYDYEITVVGVDALTLTDSVDGCGGLCTSAASNKFPICVDPNNPNLGLIPECNAAITGYNNANLAKIVADGGVISETCEGTCIVIVLDGTPPASAEGKEFIFTTTGQGLPTQPFTIKTDSQQSGALGEGIKAFSPLQPEPPAGDRTFIITGFPPGGSQGDFQLDQVTSNSTGCTFVVLTEGTGNNKTKIGVTVTSLEQGAVCVLNLHVH